MALWYGLMLMPFIAFAVLWWNYRRKQAARNQMADLRWKEIVAKPQAASGTGDVTPTEPPASLRPVGGSVASATTAIKPGLVAAARYEARARVLNNGEVLMLQLLRHALPDHAVLPGLPLDALLSPAPRLSPEVRTAAESVLTNHTADFTVCDGQWRAIAVIELVDPAPVTAPGILREMLAQAGIRHIRISRDSLPRKEALRAQVLGQAPVDDAPAARHSI